MPNALAKRIDARLKQMNLSANAASLMAGGSRDLIRNLKRGLSSQFNAEHLLRLAEILQVPPSFFSTDYADSGTLPAPAAYPSEITERRLKAIGHLAELSPAEEQSFLEELEAMAQAARARRLRGELGRP
ncbi:hypothetical protein ABNQ39_00435 (plasmid) [Azospirillum sp. A26]|uniref:hypothetical protein n=1 Tax=Azospirillum sp. A26 TaxID=3160607 RepID=UPI00366BF82E